MISEYQHVNIEVGASQYANNIKTMSIGTPKIAVSGILFEICIIAQINSTAFNDIQKYKFQLFMISN